MGVITEATIQLHAQPEAREFASVGFDSFEQGYPAVVRLFDIGLVPALIDLTEEVAPPDDAAPCTLYLGFEGYREEVEAQRSRAVAEALAAGGRDLGPGPTREYWASRHAVAERWRDRTRPLRPSERWREQRWRRADYLHIAYAGVEGAWLQALLRRDRREVRTRSAGVRGVDGPGAVFCVHPLCL